MKSNRDSAARSFLGAATTEFSIPEPAIAELISIWRNIFSEDLSHRDAQHIARRLLTFYARISRPLPSENDQERQHPIA